MAEFNAGMLTAGEAAAAGRAAPLETGKSEALWQRTIELIPSGCQTFSRGPMQHVNGVAPKYNVRGKGSRVWDPDGNVYIDYMMGLGPVILGHADEQVNAAVTETIADGVCLSLPHPLETEVAELLVERVPCAEMVRYGKNGSDVTAAAVRAARGHTRRDKIARCGYHGWQDWAIGTTTRNLGVPQAVRELTLPFPYDDIEALHALFKAYPGEIAAVIMEPITFDLPGDGYLESVKELAHANGALLIFDEVITGFRAAIGGAQEMLGVVPDLACFGKAMGNGFPIASVCGRADVMEIFDEIFFSFTFGGELASLAAGKATIHAIEEREAIVRIHRMGRRLIEGYNALAKDAGADAWTRMVGFDFWPEYLFDEAGGASALAVQSLFRQEIVRRGILSRPGLFVSAAHGEEEITETLAVFGKALAVVAEAVSEGKVMDWLEGDVIQPVIRAPAAK